MNDKTVAAYAKAFTVVQRALDRGKKPGDRNNPYDWEKCCLRPSDGFTPLYLRAVKTHALTQTDEDLIAAFLDEVDADDNIHTPRPIPPEQQALWQLTYFHWDKVYTVEEAAEELGVSKQRITALIRNGQLDAVKVRNRYYYIAGYSVERRKHSEKNEESEE